MREPRPVPTSGRAFDEFWRSVAVADHGIYRAYDAAGRLLYVGITRGLRARFRQHFEESLWIDQVARLEFEPGYTEAEARSEEERQIKGLRPIHNKIHALPDKATRTGPLPSTDRHALVLAVLNGENKAMLGRRYGVSRRWVYDLLEDAVSDPEGRLAEAEDEAAFRREVRDILAERDAAG